MEQSIAIVGIGCRFPGGANSPAILWQHLQASLDGIVPVPAERWPGALLYDPDPNKAGKIRNPKGGFIQGVDQFDADFFGYYPTEAERIDPQQRLLLEVAYEALEDGGARLEELSGSRTSVFMAAFAYDYLALQLASEGRDYLNPYVAMGTAPCALANRISYRFNLKGPSVAFDTACSGSLVAVHMACQSIWQGEAEAALAGGVNLMLRPETSMMLSRAGFLNDDGYCKTFDAAGNGYVRSEGVGVVYLKPLTAALAAGDRIYAQILASAINQDGFTAKGFTVPNPAAQADLLRTVYAKAGVCPQQVDYVEAHGTGTSIGDPIEAEALGGVLGVGRPDDQPLPVGSLKTILGHMESAAGVAGLIKAALTVQKRQIIPNLHFHTPNPQIPFERYHLQVPTTLIDLPLRSQPLLAGINSFGAGGTNAHVVLAEHQPAAHGAAATPAAAEAAALLRTRQLFLISAKSDAALQALAQAYVAFLPTSDDSLLDICYSAASRRSRFAHQLVIVTTSKADLQQKLTAFLNQEKVEGVKQYHGDVSGGKLAFLYSGQGSQWVHMGQALLAEEPVFRTTMLAIDRLFTELAGHSLLAVFADEQTLHKTANVQPAIMAVQVALTELLHHYGLQPAGITGHSIGEVAAAYAAGALDLEQAVYLIYQRARIQAQVAGKGKMLAAGLSAKEAAAFVTEGVSIATINGPRLVTFSGDATVIAQIAQQLTAQGIFNRAVNVEVPYHSHYMATIEAELVATLGEVRGKAAQLPLYSTVTTQRASGEHLEGSYWYANVREPVRFTETVATMLADGYDTFIELGPHPVLVTGVSEIAAEQGRTVTVLATMRRQQEGIFLQTLGALLAQGFALNPVALFGPGRRYVALPHYPWQHARYWFEAAPVQNARFPHAHPFLGQATQMVTERTHQVWPARVSVAAAPYLRDYQIDGALRVPAPAYLELAYAVAKAREPEQQQPDPAQIITLRDLHFATPLVLSEQGIPTVRLELNSEEGDFAILAHTAEAGWITHAQGQIDWQRQPLAPPNAQPTLSALQRRFADVAAANLADFYATNQRAGLHYGELFQGVRHLQHDQGEILAEVSLPIALHHEAAHYGLHPALLEACLHSGLADVQGNGAGEQLYLPQTLERFTLYQPASTTVFVYTRVRQRDAGWLLTDTLLFDAQGALVAEVRGLRYQAQASAHQQALYANCYEYQWVATPITAAYLPAEIKQCILFGEADEASGVAAALATTRPDVRLLINPADSLLDCTLDRRTHILFLASAKRHASSETLAQTLLGLAQEILRQPTAAPNLFVITHNADAAPGDVATNLAQAVLTGMARVINYGYPNLVVRTIDLSDASAAPDPSELAALIAEITHWHPTLDESEVALRGNCRYIRRMAPVDLASATAAASRILQARGSDYYAELAEPGCLESVVFRQRQPALGERVALAMDEVEIIVQSAGLNRKDVMKAAAPGRQTSNQLGLEVAGVVARVGAQVSDLHPGDAVIACVTHGFGGRVTANRHCVALKPPHLSFGEAAAIPIAYLTAYYALHHLARITAADTVLIHAATGGVGLAAVRLAQHVGATIIATAGTPEKQAYLRSLGIEHVYSSRSGDFAASVLAVTGGRGVDIVLNSLTDEFMAQSMKCLAPFGRFVEINKQAIEANRKLGLRQLGENIAYFVVDVERLATQKPRLHQQLLTAVVELFNREQWASAPVQRFPVEQLATALKTLAETQPIGKLVVEMGGEPVTALAPRQLQLAADKSYLITGGASGFGLEVAKWFVQRGARSLILLSRSGPHTPADQATFAHFAAQGVQLYDARLDVSDGAAVAQFFHEVLPGLPPLAGIVHGAATRDDALIPEMTWERFLRVWQPKALGALHLHEATREQPLDFFLMFSSVAAAFGFAGLINYGAANYFLDALAVHRRLQGLPATTLNLGVLGSYAGMSRGNEAELVNDLMASRGYQIMPLDTVLQQIELALLQQPVQRVTATLDWRLFSKGLPHLQKDARFVALLTGDGASRRQAADLRSQALALTEPEQADFLQERLVTTLATILNLAAARMAVDEPLDRLGLDSLMLNQIHSWILRQLAISYPMRKLLQGPTIRELVRDLVSMLNADDAKGSALPTGDSALPGGEADEAASSETESSETGSSKRGSSKAVVQLSPWLLRSNAGRRSPDKLRLFCFPAEGTGASLFTPFLQNPPPGFEVYAIQLPGRENQAQAALPASSDLLVAQIAQALQPYLEEAPYLLWGHGFGGIIAYETLRYLQMQQRPAPLHLLVSAAPAPQLVTHWQQRRALLRIAQADNSAEYLNALARSVEDPGLIKRIAPLLRQDLPLLLNYRCTADEGIDVPITTFGAYQDELVYPDEIEAWTQQTTAAIESFWGDGDHWFLARQQALLTAKLTALHARYTAVRRPSFRFAAPALTPVH